MKEYFNDFYNEEINSYNIIINTILTGDNNDELVVVVANFGYGEDATLITEMKKQSPMIDLYCKLFNDSLEAYKSYFKVYALETSMNALAESEHRNQPISKFVVYFHDDLERLENEE